jgi:hypothetical protein
MENCKNCLYLKDNNFCIFKNQTIKNPLQYGCNKMKFKPLHTKNMEDEKC